MPLPGVNALCGSPCRTKDGAPCDNPAMPNGRCHMHGGETPAGIASPHWKTGRNSRHRNLPQRLIPALEASLADPDLLNLRQEIAALDARIADLESRVDTGESGEIWRSLKDTVDSLGEAQEKADRLSGEKRAEALSEVQQCIETIETLCQEGVADYSAWDEVIRLKMLRAKLVEADVKRRVALKTDIPVEQVGSLIQAFEGLVTAHVKDPEALRKITTDLREIAQEYSGSA